METIIVSLKASSTFDPELRTVCLLEIDNSGNISILEDSIDAEFLNSDGDIIILANTRLSFHYGNAWSNS